MPLPLLIGLAALGGLKITGDIFGAIAKRDAALEAEKTARRNAALAGSMAISVEQSAQKRGSQVRQEASAMINAQRAEMAGRNLNLDYGAPVDIARTTRYYSETDIQTLQNNAAKEAWGIREKQSDYNRAAVQYRKQADNAILEGFLNAGSTAVGTVVGMDKMGAFSGLGGGQQTQGISAAEAAQNQANTASWDAVFEKWDTPENRVALSQANQMRRKGWKLVHGKWVKEEPYLPSYSGGAS